MRKGVWRLVGLGLSALLAACGGAAGGGGFSGTVTAPQGFTIQGTEVLACFYLQSSDSCDESKSKTTTLSGSGRSASFAIDGLASGDYVIIAGKQGLLGVFVDNQGNPAIVRPPRSGINIELKQVSGGSLPRSP
ncbi:hypothetical protein [Allomeiothermus silvanus]|uniref:hypothetical protein n=1 Tax=Allomeiothermus silvanus TaxID=52022 RepID=UPI0023F54CA6|nr:hypothetical protein [Allomeiothermus silvanus]